MPRRLNPSNPDKLTSAVDPRRESRSRSVRDQYLDRDLDRGPDRDLSIRDLALRFQQDERAEKADRSLITEVIAGLIVSGAFFGLGYLLCA